MRYHHTYIVDFVKLFTRLNHNQYTSFINMLYSHGNAMKDIKYNICFQLDVESFVALIL